MKLIRYSRAGSMLRLGVINNDRAVAADPEVAVAVAVEVDDARAGRV